MADAAAVATHDAIWKAQGLCSGGCGSPRDLLCPSCSRAYCARCLDGHSHTPREIYLARIYKGKVKCFTPEEEREAVALCEGAGVE